MLLKTLGLKMFKILKFSYFNFIFSPFIVNRTILIILKMFEHSDFNKYSQNLHKTYVRHLTFKLYYHQDGLKLNGTHQVLAYADDVNILGGSVDNVK